MVRKAKRKRKPSTRSGGGTALVTPKGIQLRYGISLATRWRWERSGRLPPRDVHVGGVLVGWKPETLDAAEAGAALG